MRSDSGQWSARQVMSLARSRAIASGPSSARITPTNLPFGPITYSTGAVVHRVVVWVRARAMRRVVDPVILRDRRDLLGRASQAFQPRREGGGVLADHGLGVAGRINGDEERLDPVGGRAELVERLGDVVQGRRADVGAERVPPSCETEPPLRSGVQKTALPNT